MNVLPVHFHTIDMAFKSCHDDYEVKYMGEDGKDEEKWG